MKQATAAVGNEVPVKSYRRICKRGLKIQNDDVKEVIEQKIKDTECICRNKTMKFNISIVKPESTERNIIA